MISFEHVSKRFGSLNALTDVSFSVPTGQVLGLLGQNGAGKTTAMNILTGCLAPSAGKVTIDGEDLLLHPREAKRKIGYLPEAVPVYDEMTVRDYLHFACKLKEVQKKAIADHVETVAEKTGLADVLDRKIGNLSKGYRQRAGVAQALCGTPDVIVLDEPTTGLDPRQNMEMRQLIRSLAGEHTILFSSHVLSEVQVTCDRVMILHHGKIICDSALHDLRNEEHKLRVVIDCAKEKIYTALQQLQSVRRVEIEKNTDPAVTQAVLTVENNGLSERELFTLLSAMQTPLLRLSPVEDSLEDVFLRATMDETA